MKIGVVSLYVNDLRKFLVYFVRDPRISVEIVNFVLYLDNLQVFVLFMEYCFISYYASFFTVLLSLFLIIFNCCWNSMYITFLNHLLHCWNPCFIIIFLAEISFLLAQLNGILPLLLFNPTTFLFIVFCFTFNDFTLVSLSLLRHLF